MLFTVSWKQAYNDPYQYKFSVVAVEIIKTQQCKKKIKSTEYANWENIICAKSVAQEALLHPGDFGSPLICLFLVPKPNPPKFGNKRYWVPIVSGIAMSQDVSDPVLYTKIAPFNQFAREQTEYYLQNIYQRPEDMSERSISDHLKFQTVLLVLMEIVSVFQ